MFPSALDLVINDLMKFVTRSGSRRGYVSRQQMWITNLVRALAKKSGYSCFFVDRRPHVFGAARYRSPVKNPTVQYCYLNSSTSDKLFDTFTSRRTDQEDKIEFIIEKQVGETARDKFPNFRQTKMAAQMVNVHRQPSSGDQVDLIEYKDGVGERDFVNRILEPSQDSSWLNLNPRVPSKDISQPPSKKKKCKRTEMEYRIVTQRQASKGYLQNRQMGKVCKKDWDTDIAYIRNVFAFVAVWINPLRIEAKIGMFAHQNLC